MPELHFASYYGLHPDCTVAVADAHIRLRFQQRRLAPLLPGLAYRGCFSSLVFHRGRSVSDRVT